MDTHKTNVDTLTISGTCNICTEIKLNLYSQRDGVNTLHVDTHIADGVKAKKNWVVWTYAMFMEGGELIILRQMDKCKEMQRNTLHLGT